MFWLFLSLLIIAALSWGVEFLCSWVVFIVLSPAPAERKNINLAAQRTALVLPLCLALDFAVSCFLGVHTIGLLSLLLVVSLVPVFTYIFLRRYVRFSRGRAFCAAVLLEVLNVLLLTGGTCFSLIV